MYDLDGPVARVCSAEVPLPYAKHLEDAALPVGRADRGRDAAGPGGGPWLTSGCRRSAPTWTKAPCWSGWCTPGTTVHKGDIVAVVDTAKAAVEVETFVEGVVTELLVDVGSKVPVGTPLARIADHEQAVPPGTAVTPAPPEPAGSARTP